VGGLVVGFRGYVGIPEAKRAVGMVEEGTELLYKEITGSRNQISTAKCKESTRVDLACMIRYSYVQIVDQKLCKYEVLG
jgi:hypothetical protein